jgi:hypothetical protein
METGKHDQEKRSGPKVKIGDILMRGKVINHNVLRSLSNTLQDALDYAGPKGYIVTMPELIAAKINVSDEHQFWNHGKCNISGHGVYTEESVGIDQEGRFYTAGEPVVVLVNGGGILTPDRLKKIHYNDHPKSDDYRPQNDDYRPITVDYSEEEFNDFLNGKLSCGESLDLFRFEEIRDGIPDLPHRFGIVLPYSMVVDSKKWFYDKKEFLEDPLVIARNAGIQNLEEFYEMAKCDDGLIINDNEFNWVNAPFGRMLQLRQDGMGFDNLGRSFVYGGNLIAVCGVNSDNPTERYRRNNV